MASSPFVGEIQIFAGNFAPNGWAFCDGSLLDISQNNVLFQLIGTIYGGDGQTTFALPDLRGRVPIHFGNGYIIGQLAGTETVTLHINQIPAHNHAITGTIDLPAKGDNPGTAATPVEGYPAISATKNYYATQADAGNGSMAPLNFHATIGSTGSSVPFNNIQPFLAVNYIISLFGIFPSQ